MKNYTYYRGITSGWIYRQLKNNTEKIEVFDPNSNHWRITFCRGDFINQNPMVKYIRKEKAIKLYPVAFKK